MNCKHTVINDFNVFIGHENNKILKIYIHPRDGEIHVPTVLKQCFITGNNELKYVDANGYNVTIEGVNRYVSGSITLINLMIEADSLSKAFTYSWGNRNTCVYCKIASLGLIEVFKNNFS